MRTLTEDSLAKIKEFESTGFAKSSSVLLNYVRNKKDIDVKMFRYGITARAGRKGGTRYSSIDIFGERIVYIYRVEYKDNFVDFIVDKFLNKNPDPDTNLRKAFTRILHLNGLHWHGCSCMKEYNEKSRKSLSITKDNDKRVQKIRSRFLDQDEP